MSLSAGTVTITDTGDDFTVPPTGYAAEIYAQLKANAVASFAQFGQALPPPGPQLAAILRPLGTQAVALATAGVSYFTAATVVDCVIPAGSMGAGVPASDVHIAGTIS